MIKYSVAITALFAVLCLLLIADILTGKKLKDKKFIYFAIALMIAISSVGLTKFDNITGHDTYFHIIRMKGIADNILRGVPFCKVDFAFNFGYGYFDPVFYPNLFLWIPAIMVTLGMSVGKAYSIFLLLINAATAIISYKCFEKISGNSYIGLAVAAVYSLNYYRMTDVYVRGALGEILFIAFLPIVLCAVYCILKKGEDKWVMLMLGACAIFQSHIIGTVLTAVLGGTLIVVYSIAALCQKKSLKKEFILLLKAGVGTVLLNLWFLVPLVYYIRQEFNLFGVSPEYFSRYLQPFKNMFGGSNALSELSILSYMSPEMAVLIIFVLAVLIFAAVKNKKTPQGIAELAVAAVILFSDSVYMPWVAMSVNPVINFIVGTLQFSFRVISIFIAICAVAAALALKNLDKKLLSIAATVIVAVFALSAIEYYSITYDYEDGNFDNVSVVLGYDGEYNANSLAPMEYFMRYADRQEAKSDNKFRSLNSNLIIKEFEYFKAGARVVVDNVSTEDNYIEIPLFYYDGYAAYSEDNDMYLPVQCGVNGVIRVVVPPQVNGTIMIQFKSKTIFHIAEAISLITLLSLISFAVLKRKKHFNKM